MNNQYNLPTWDMLIPKVIQLASKQRFWNRYDLKKQVVQHLSLPRELKNLTYDDHNSHILDDRVEFTISRLLTAQVLTRFGNDMYQLSPLGHDLASQPEEELTRKRIERLPAYQAHLEELKERNQRKQVINHHNDLDHLSTNLDNQTTAYNNDIETQLLQRILNNEPRFFEKLVVDLLAKMGYRGLHGTASVTPVTKDGGIDGIINQDPLGTNTIYIQAKRFDFDRSVTRPLIESFYGALKNHNADQGVMITTSHFSDGAKIAANRFSIILIDGIRLTDLMLKYQVGVYVKHIYRLFGINDNFFDL